MFIEPREHDKTVRWSFAYVLWCLLFGRARYVLLIGASGDSANENLGNIRTELEENERILEDFGDLKGEVWTNRRLELKNNSCVQAKGSGASMSGTRFRQFRPYFSFMSGAGNWGLGELDGCAFGLFAGRWFSFVA